MGLISGVYILNAIPYLSKNESLPSTQKLTGKAVMTLMEPFMDKGRNVSRRDFLFKFATELRQNYIVERSSRNTINARPHQLTTAFKNTKA